MMQVLLILIVNRVYSRQDASVYKPELFIYVPDIVSFLFVIQNRPDAPLVIKEIMIVLFKILTWLHFTASQASWLNLNEILIILIPKGMQGEIAK